MSKIGNFRNKTRPLQIGAQQQIAPLSKPQNMPSTSTVPPEQGSSRGFLINPILRGTSQVASGYEQPIGLTVDLDSILERIQASIETEVVNNDPYARESKSRELFDYSFDALISRSTQFQKPWLESIGEAAEKIELWIKETLGLLANDLRIGFVGESLLDFCPNPDRPAKIDMVKVQIKTLKNDLLISWLYISMPNTKLELLEQLSHRILEIKNPQQISKKVYLPLDLESAEREMMSICQKVLDETLSATEAAKYTITRSREWNEEGKYMGRTPYTRILVFLERDGSRNVWITYEENAPFNIDDKMCRKRLKEILTRS
ncbi:MAG: hypothetical protein ABIE74_13150 [Pseudomonadota bacterium]